MDFDGVGDYVEIQHDETLEPPAASERSITIEAWIKPKLFGDSDGIVSKYNETGEPSYTLRLRDTDGQVQFQIDDNDDTVEIYSDSKVSLDQWTHVAAVYDGNNGWLRLYINGKLDFGYDWGTGLLATNESVVTIGVDYLPSARYFHGSIDEVRIWNVARTEEEIAGHMNVKLSGNEPGLMGYWSMDEGSGNMVYDQTGNNNDGTIVGNPTWVDGAF